MPKKKTALTIEERLQQALVPAEEQPYEVPENWVWVYGKNILMPMESKKPDGEDFYYIDIDAIDNKNQVVTEAKKIKTAQAPSRASRKLHTGDTVFSLVRPYLKNIAYIDEQLSECIASTGFFVCTPNTALNDKYLYNLMVSSYVVDGLNKYMKGDNSPSIRKDDIENYPFPLPPLSEQQRIVERIEELFAKLDEAKERLQEVADSFAVRKAAILHKAFTGELTKQWRLENSMSDESWEEKKFDDCIEKMQNGLSKRKGDEGNNIGVLRLANLGEDDLVLDDLRYILLTEKEEKNYLLSKDDVIMIRVNGSKDNVARQIVINIDEKLAFCDHIIRIKYNPNIVARYVMYFSKTNAYRKYVEDNMVSSAGQNTISRKGLASLVIPLPSIEEQHEIVRLIDELLARERAAQQAAEQALASIDLMKKSILARAFRGELGTNKASEASALELLKQVLAED